MIYTAEELKIKVINARLMSRAELNEHEDNVPDIGDSCWWLSDVDENDEDYVAYAEGNCTEEEMFCSKTDSNTYVRVVLDIDTSEASVGKEFTFSGYVFTVLSSELAISNNFLGKAKYYDEDLLNYIYTDDEIVCTLKYNIADMIKITSNEGDSEEDDEVLSIINELSQEDIDEITSFLDDNNEDSDEEDESSSLLDDDDENFGSYNIVSYEDGYESVCPCSSFFEARVKFRETISRELNTKIMYYTEMIRDYCDKYYPTGMPDELKNVITLLKRIVKEPDYFDESAKELDFRTFTDERITVFTKTWEGKELYINSETDEFPIMEISCLDMNDEDEEYYFFISDLNRENKCDIQLEKN